MKTFADYDEYRARLREINSAAREARWLKVASPVFDPKQDMIEEIEETQLRETERRGSIYFLRESGMGAIKIGASTNVQKRVRSLSLGMPHELTLLATMPGWYVVEALVKKLFVHARIRGEWFRPVPELLGYIDKVKARP